MPRFDEAADLRSSVEALDQNNHVSPGDSRAGRTAAVVVAVLAALLIVTGLIVVAICIRRRRHQLAAPSTGIIIIIIIVNSTYEVPSVLESGPNSEAHIFSPPGIAMPPARLCFTDVTFFF